MRLVVGVRKFAMSTMIGCCTATPRTNHEGLSTPVLVAFAVTCAMSVANIYYAQPLLDSLASSFSIPPSSIGIVVTLTQAGYALGLFFVVPFGDIVDRRKLIVAMTAASAVALLGIGTAQN